jgi:hypothetical protein
MNRVMHIASEIAWLPLEAIIGARLGACTRHSR